MARHLRLAVIMWQGLRNDRLFLVSLAALIALAWVSLLAWGQSPYERFLDHRALTDVTSEDVGPSFALSPVTVPTTWLW